jgi:hypothetical protein
VLHTDLENGPRTETYHTEIIIKVGYIVSVSYLLINVRNTLI